MTVFNPVWVGVPDQAASDGWVIQWGPMLQGDTALPITETSQMVGHADRSVQVEGTFGGAGSVSIQGSNDAVNFEILNDPSITPLVFTSAKLRAILEACRQIKPVLSGGDGSTSLTVSLLVRRLR